ncbi:MAG TPA: tetratricopeptide repeat protein, partial [Candidatus Eisenbacteria bacterium]
MNPPTGAGRRLPRWSLAVFLALALSSTGCAYYNTFYLAKRYYRDAVTEEERNTTDRISPAATAAYEKAIKQCARILQKYRGSKWVDDALLLTGKSFYGQGNYGEARRWLSQLVNEHPKSELLPEAQVWIGRTWLAEEDYEKSGSVLHGVLADIPQFEARSEAVFFAAETELRQEHWEQAIKEFRELIERYPKSERVGQALFLVGDAQFGLRQYQEAERSYRQSAARAREPRDRMQALLKVGQMLEKQERFDEATHLYDGLSAEIVPRDKLNTILSGFEAALPNQPLQGNAANSGLNEQQLIEQGSYQDANGNTVFPNPNFPRDNVTPNGNPNNLSADPAAPAAAPPDPRRTGEGNAAARGALNLAIASNPLAADLPQVLLRQGNALMEMGEYDKAIKTFESVLASTPHTSEAGEAQYRIGYILEVYLEDYAGARIAYDLVKQHGAGLFVEQATRRSGGLERLVALAAQDSTRATGANASLEAEAEKQFLAAELAWFQQEKPEKAIDLYAEVERNYPNTSFAPRSALARAWLLANVMADTTAGREAFESVTVTYADTEQARIAHQILTGEV